LSAQAQNFGILMKKGFIGRLYFGFTHDQEIWKKQKKASLLISALNLSIGLKMSNLKF
jgi:hypothetical protein